MNVLKQILDGSLLSNERLMQAREHYAPTRDELSPERAFARWTQRVSVQAELGSAREIAGLTEAELSAMEDEFLRCPERPRPAWLRRAMPTGVALASLGGLALGVQGLVGGISGAALVAVQALSGACLLIGLVILAVAALSAFASLHLELCHGTTGLYFGRLDEQHPWLFKTMNLTHNPAAEEYRQRILRDRGWLRGVDFVMMREIVRSQEAVEQTSSTRSVAEKIQLLPAPPKVQRAQQPRLVPVSSRVELGSRLMGSKFKAAS